MPYEDRFGHLRFGGRLVFDGGTVTPVEEFEDAIAAVRLRTHPDGHIYPPIIHTVQATMDGQTMAVPQSQRAALLHRLPSTHSIRLEQTFEDAQQARHNAAGFVVHFVGFVYGFRCQFFDWWFDRRVSATSGADYISPTPTEASRVVGTALSTWRALGRRQQRVATNALYLHSRTHTYELPWERFQAEYQVFDAVFALSRDSGQLHSSGRVKHDRRIPAMCERYAIPCKDDLVATVRRLRNDLLHEALWDGGMPGDAGSSEAIYAALWLNRLTRRLLFAVLGLTGGYVTSAWWHLGQHSFAVRTAHETAV